MQRGCLADLEIANISRDGAARNVLNELGAGNGNLIDRTKGATVSGSDETSDLSPADKKRMTDQIGRQLRGMYDGLLNQPVPDRFMELVGRLEKGGLEPDRES